MWDSPRLLNAVANALFALAIALVVYGGGRALVESRAFPLRTVRVLGDLQQVGRPDVVHALQGKVEGTFFTADLDAISALFRAIPWVRRADIRRQWPDLLEVTLEEHVALARWGQGKDASLVNTHGELFTGRSDATLPLFSGPAGTEGEIARRYQAFRSLLAPLELQPQRVALSARFAWQLRLSNGLAVRLGRESEKDSLEDRLARFVAAYPQALGKLGRDLDYVDLRYPNGFALRVPDSSRPDFGKAQRKRV